MRWTWDPKKNRDNKRGHLVSFETAQLVFDDPLAVSRKDTHPLEERWQTIGQVGPVIPFVVHTWPDPATGEEIVRIISAPKATAHERRAYEEGSF
ncbi:MAG: BrnT family toxin [Alphaproteobacteria bacterium]